MASIFDISDWDGATTYSKHDIVKNGPYYYYSLVDSNLNQDPTISNSVYWGGMKLDSAGIQTPHFIWKPTINSSFMQEPKVKMIQFGDGYSQRIKDGINNNLIKFEVNFNGKTIKEARAILHFLHTREGVNAFLYTAPEPYDKEKRFIAKTWTPSNVFYDNWNIKATFDEVVF